jgi:hypothetical protein
VVPTIAPAAASLIAFGISLAAMHMAAFSRTQPFALA